MKLLLHAMHENELPFINGGEHISWAPEIPILWSLGTIVGILAVTTVLSLVASSRQDRTRPPADADRPSRDADSPVEPAGPTS